VSIIGLPFDIKTQYQDKTPEISHLDAIESHTLSTKFTRIICVNLICHSKYTHNNVLIIKFSV